MMESEPSTRQSVDAPEVALHQRLRDLRDDGVDTLIIGAPDLNGRLRVKRFSIDLFFESEVEIAFSEYIFSADIAENLMTPRDGYRGYFPTAAAGLPDLFVQPDWDQIRVLPWEPRAALVLGDFVTHEGRELAVAPRTILKRVITRLHERGFYPMTGVEYEFLIFKCDPSRPSNDLGALTPLSTGPAYGYSRAALDEQHLGPLRRMIQGAGIPVEAVIPEAAPGQFEITIRYSDAMSSADNAYLYKDFVHELLGAQGLIASFIAKYGPEYGSSGHVHISLRDEDGRPLMVDAGGALSSAARHAIAGHLATVQEFTAIYAPLINSYSRHHSEYSFAGNTVAWGIDNRTCGLRVIHTTPYSTRLECRTPGADMNPYLTLAALLAGIGHGLEKALDPPAAVYGDAYRADGVERVPHDLHSATDLFSRSDVARDWLGDEFVDFYTETRLWEVQQHRMSVSDWEIQRYLR